jgi:hypothetical protein
MRFFSASFKVLTCALFIASLSAVAQAQATRTWVSGVGADDNPCSRTAPCKTYAGAILKTAVNGEISTLDPGGYGTVTITKSITIEGTQGQGYGSILHGGSIVGTTGVTINFDNFTSAGESNKTVRLRNLNINGSAGAFGNASSGLRSIRILGAAAATGTEVFIEDCVLDGSQGSPGRGIEDNRAGGGLLSISRTTVRNMAGSGLSTLTTTNGLKIVITDSKFSMCANGIAVGNNVKISIFNSNISGNTGAGLFVEDLDGAGANTVMDVDHCIVTHNGTGFNASSGNSIIRVSNTTATNNTTLASTAGGGLVNSYGNNQTGGTAFPGSVGPN